MLLKKRPPSEILVNSAKKGKLKNKSQKNEIQKMNKKINQKMYSEKLIELTKK